MRRVGRVGVSVAGVVACLLVLVQAECVGVLVMLVCVVFFGLKCFFIEV